MRFTPVIPYSESRRLPTGLPTDREAGKGGAFSQTSPYPTAFSSRTGQPQRSDSKNKLKKINLYAPVERYATEIGQKIQGNNLPAQSA